MKKSLILIVLWVCSASFAWSQDGHAMHSPLFNPEPQSELPEEVRETSGLFFHNGRLWTHNDSGGKPILYALDTTSFEVVQRITLSNAKNKDWEDICTDGERVFVGDFGNNNGSRDKLRIYTFPLSAIPDKGDASVRVDTINFSFGDQNNFEKRKVHDFDCEAVFVTDEFLYLFSKGWETATTRLYRLPKTPGNHVAEVVNGFDSKGLVTGADYDRENGILVVVGYARPLWQPFVYLIYDFDDEGVNLDNRRFEMPNHLSIQIEGVCFFAPGRCYISAESSKTFAARVFKVNFSKWISKDRKKKK